MQNKPIVRNKTTQLECKINGRSSDFVTPNFILGCNGGCSYCYVDRWNRPNVYISENLNKILSSIESHHLTLPRKKPNQVDPNRWVYDIGCSTDVMLHWKDYPWKEVLKFFNRIGAKSTFATKVYNSEALRFLEVDSEAHRIRFSLNTLTSAYYTEQKVSSVANRIKGITTALRHGWEVHMNFSPVIFYDGWIEDYKYLFNLISEAVPHDNSVKSEVIFLTHNRDLHERNAKSTNEKVRTAEQVLWRPEFQEAKISQYGGHNVRYERVLKSNLIKQFTKLHQECLPWSEIRYIF